MTTGDEYLPYVGLDIERFIERLNITKGNEFNAYDYTSNLSQSKTIAKKNFSVLFSDIFCVYELKTISEGGKPKQRKWKQVA